MKNKKLLTALIISTAIISACSTKSTQSTTETTNNSNQVVQPTTEPTLTNSTEPIDLDSELNSITITDPTQELLNSEK